MKILVIGSAGMLGHMVTLYLRSRGYNVTDVSNTRKINENTIKCNVLLEEELQILNLVNYDYIINCAALLVKESEKYKDQAVLLNSWFPHRLEKLLISTKTKIIHISTDGIFSGLNQKYKEIDICDSNTFYGRTKYLGEIVNNKDITIRTSVVGPDLFKSGTGLFNWFLSQNNFVWGFENTYFNAVTTLEFAKLIEYIINNNFSGIYHLCASEIISKAEFLRKTKIIFNLDNIDIKSKYNDKTDNSLLNTRKDIKYLSKSYDQMLKELKNWMFENKEIYIHYKFMQEEIQNGQNHKNWE